MAVTEPNNAEREHTRRRELWQRLDPESGDRVEATAETLRREGVYRTGRGIYADLTVTRETTGDPRGATVSVLHKGGRYADSLRLGGMTYHYPVTLNPGTDDSDVDATKAALELGLPVFVIVDEGKRVPVDDGYRGVRTVRPGWVLDWNDEAREFAIEFGTIDSPARPLEPVADDDPFELTDKGDRKRRDVLTRTGQTRFRAAVLARYPVRCVACAIADARLLDAAHLCPKSAHGSDDPRNGIVLCASHHRAFDEFLIGIEPRTHEIHTAPGLNAQALGVTRDRLESQRRPAREALEWRWGAWVEKHPAAN